MVPIFITGIGTDVGKTVVSAIVTEALGAHYWKPVQAGFDQGTDSQWVAERISSPHGRILPETYRLRMPASPHIAAREEKITISLDKIKEQYLSFKAAMPAPAGGKTIPLVIEGAGGLLVPLNDDQFVPDLVKALDATVLLVSRNYLGSINHSLLTAAVCKAHQLKVAGWIFNEQYLHYETEIARWTSLPIIGSIPRHPAPDSEFIREQAERIRPALHEFFLM